MLSFLLKQKIDELHISNREAARRIGIAPSTIGNILQGKVVDIDILIKVCEWLEVDPRVIFKDYLGKESTLADKFAAIVEEDPRLAKVFGDALDRVLRKEVDPSIISDLVNYATWRLSRSDGNGNQSNKHNAVSNSGGNSGNH